jgi:hypothetical protein
VQQAKKLQSPQPDFSQALKLLKSLKIYVLYLRTEFTSNQAEVCQYEEVDKKFRDKQLPDGKEEYLLATTFGSKMFQIET